MERPTRYGISSAGAVIPRVKAAPRQRANPVRQFRQMQPGALDGDGATSSGGTMRVTNRGGDKGFIVLVAGLIVLGALAGAAFHVFFQDRADVSTPEPPSALNNPDRDAYKPDATQLTLRKPAPNSARNYRDTPPIRTPEPPAASFQPELETGLQAYRARNYVAALRHVEPLARQGEAKAQVILARMYLDGAGVAQSFDTSLRWFERAAELGSPDGHAGLGWLHQMGQGVERDVAKAAAYYHQAANGGSAWGQVRLGWLLQQGLGLDADIARAATLYRQAATSGHAEAQAKLAWLLSKGLGLPENDAEGLQWARRAADQGNPAGQNLLGWLLHSRDDGKDSEALLWLEKSASQGFAQAQANLAWIYANGQAVVQDPAKAARLLSQAAATGSDPLANPAGVPIPTR